MERDYHHPVAERIQNFQNDAFNFLTDSAAYLLRTEANLFLPNPAAIVDGFLDLDQSTIYGKKTDDPGHGDLKDVGQKTEKAVKGDVAQNDENYDHFRRNDYDDDSNLRGQYAVRRTSNDMQDSKTGADESQGLTGYGGGGW